jgi:hypothetical protein
MSEVDMNVELPIDESSLEEGSAQQMPVGTEADAVASVDKAEDGVKSKAPARKGDNTKQDPAPKTKAGLLNAMYGKLSSMKKAELNAAYDKMSEEFEDMEVSDAVELPEFSVTDELNDLVESEQTLSDEFKAKTAVIFDTAIRSKLSEEVERIEDEDQSRLDEELEATRSDLVEKVDSYLNYVVENWMKENQIAVESGLRTEIAENFMGSLKDLFVESYIEVPESKVNLVDELAEQVSELEEKLNAQTGSAIEMSEQIETLQREAIIRESAGDLADTQVEKLKGLVESLDFEDAESFAHKVKTVKESYFKKDVAVVEEEINEDWTAEASAPASGSVMEQYLTAIKKSNK